MGDRDFRTVIKNSIESVGKELDYKIDIENLDKIHLGEVTKCLRRSYYDRTDPAEPERTRFSDLIGGMFRKLDYGSISATFDLKNGASLEGQSDMIADDVVMIFRSVSEFPEDPFAKDILYLNACLWIYDKIDGIIVYIDGNGKEGSFSLTKDKKMFEELVRRVQTYRTLLNDKKLPQLEPSTECTTCQYYERCFTKKKRNEKDVIHQILGMGKED
jgi:CRISPR-associated exonuclease Cas4|tara:strand:+ start:20213 stop:20860 length:648 start_codon:yes stop_codon:yes gene_type:complete